MSNKILTYEFADFFEKVRSFHGFPAPGVLVGGFMVDLALRQLPEGTGYEAICESAKCLPDAVQILTPCSMGNGRVRVIPLGRYALALYDKISLQGVRVYVDSNKMDPWPELKAWFLKLKSKKDQNTELIYAEIENAGSQILSSYPITLKPEMARKKEKSAIAQCPHCHEAYPLKDGPICLGCLGGAPYLIQ